MTGAKTSPAWNLQVAEYTRLTSDDILDIPKDPVPIFENVPPNTQPPYVRLGSFYIAEHWETNTTAGVVARTQIDAYSQRASRQEAAQMLVQIKALITATKLTVTDFATVRQVAEVERLLDESTPAGPLHHAILELTYRLQQD